MEVVQVQISYPSVFLGAAGPGLDAMSPKNWGRGGSWDITTACSLCMGDFRGASVAIVSCGMEGPKQCKYDSWHRRISGKAVQPFLCLPLLYISPHILHQDETYFLVSEFVGEHQNIVNY